MRSSKYTAETLGPIVASARSYAEVMRKLGLKPTGGNHRFITARIREAGLDTSHFGRRDLASIPRETLELLVQQSTSIAQVLTRLGLPVEGRPHHDLSRRIESLEIDTTHLKGRGWSRGETAQTHASVLRVSRNQRMPDAEMFVENSRVVTGRKITRRLLELGWAYECAWCGISTWRGQPLVLHLDHINGVNNDNRLENIRLLCPNCHSQTPTYCGRNR